MPTSRRRKDGPMRTRSPLERLAWDNLRLLLILAESGSFRSAAVKAGVALNTLRSKIDRLELQFGTPLLVRSVEGVRLTHEGYELVAIARQMQQLGKSANRVRQPDADRSPASVRVNVTEGVGTFWLVPRLVEFRAGNPDIGVSLNCDMAPPDVLFRDTDIAIQLTEPNAPGLFVQRIGTVHAMPFAAASYLTRKGTPTGLAEIGAHDLVWQDAEQIATDRAPSLLDMDAVRQRIVMRTNTSSAHYWAVAGGAGIGFLPTYARALGRDPQALDLGLRLDQPIYMIHHPDAPRLPLVARTIDGIRAAFDGNRYPWFADSFIHPNDFAARMNEADLASFEGFKAD